LITLKKRAIAVKVDKVIQGSDFYAGNRVDVLVTLALKIFVPVTVVAKTSSLASPD
jgi:Flp pilus assembly protein CpaB